MKNVIYFFFGVFLVFIVVFASETMAASSGYVPAASVSPGSTLTTIKAVMSKIGTLPSDTLARVYPSVAAGARIAASTVGAAASSVYAGSAAVSSKMFVGLKSGATLGINIVANMPKSALVSAALVVMKSPYLAVAVGVGSALYSWYQSADISKNPDGTYNALPPLIGTGQYNYTLNAFPGTYASAQIGCTALAHSNDVAGIGILITNNTQCKLYHGQAWVDVNNSYGTTNISAVLVGCQAGYTLSGGVCNRNVGAVSVPISDVDIATRLQNQPIVNPAALLPELIANGVTPDVDPPVLSVDAVPATTSTKTNPDGSKVITVTTVNNTVAGDTVASDTTITTTNKDPAGAVTGVTTEKIPTSIDPVGSSAPAVDTPVQDNSAGIIAAINAASQVAQDKAAIAHADIIAEPQKMMDAVPTALPVPPPITPDTGLFFDFLNTINPFSFHASDYLPALPESACTYEIHSVWMGKNIDLAPCVKLQPLRTVLAWVFAVLAAWSCFLIIFRAQM